MHTFIENNVIDRVATSAASATGTISTDRIDMAERDSVVFIASLGSATATGTYTLQVQHSSSNSASTMVTTDATVAAIATTVATDKVIAVEAIRPTKRYVRAQLVRPAGGALDGIVAIISGVNRGPVTQSGDVLNSAAKLHPTT